MYTVSSSGDYGDVIAHSACWFASGEIDCVTLFPSTGRTRIQMTEQHAQPMLPLLNEQPWICEAVWKAVPDEQDNEDFDNWRFKSGHSAVRQRTLAHQYATINHLPTPMDNEPWLTVEPIWHDFILFNRTFRHRNRRFDFKTMFRKFRDRALFVGLADEWEDFQKEMGEPVRYQPTETLLDLARWIRGAKLCVFGTSCPLWIAASLGVPCVVELGHKNSNLPRIGTHYNPFMRNFKLDIEKNYFNCAAAKSCRRSLITADRLAVIAKYAHKIAREFPGLPSAEVGVCRGGSANVIAWSNTCSKIHLFDTWEGLPFEENGCVHKKGEFAADLSDTKRFLRLWGDRCQFHRGVFPESIPEALVSQQFGIVHLDMDLPSVLSDALDFFLPRSRVIIIDDYGWRNTPGIQEVVKRKGLTIRQETDNQAIWEKI